METLAIIPAREGSKGILNKNIIELNGKPLIAWTIIAAKQSQKVDRIIVSTDSQQIAKVALEYGAEVPFIRPKELAQDDSSSMDVVLHAIKYLSSNEQYKPDYTMLLQPTSPLRNKDDVSLVANMLEESHSLNSIVSVTAVVQHPSLMVKINDDNSMKLLNDLYMGSGNRHDYLPVYALNGSIYVAKTQDLENHKTWYNYSTFPYIMPRERSIDIDIEEDLVVAEYYMRKLNS